MSSTQKLWTQIQQAHAKWMLGHESLIELLFVAYLARGHVLLEGPPGTGKTLTAKLIARLLSQSFKRVQFTSDLLPADILGAHIFAPEQKAFQFIQGPIFTDILLADEINRTPPRTQSALLEAMEEKQVTIDGKAFRLNPDFFVLATQNPRDYEGTFLLPEVQLDRFLFKVVLDHLDLEKEAQIMDHILQGVLPPKFENIEPLSFNREEIDQEIKNVKVDPSLLNCVAKILQQARSHPMIASGSSVRGGIALVRTARIRALVEGRDFVIADDIKILALPVLRHRMQLNPEAQVAQISEVELMNDLLNQVEFPA